MFLVDMDGVVLVLQQYNEMQETLSRRCDKLHAFGLRMQPSVVVVGTTEGTGPLSQRSAIAKVRYRKGPGLGLGLVRVSLPLTPTI